MLTYILMLEIGLLRNVFRAPFTLWQRSNTTLLLYSEQNAGD